MGPTRIRVHRVITRLNVGGPAQHVVALAERLDREFAETHLLAGRVSRGEADMADAVAAAGIHVETVPGLTPTAGLAGDVRALLWLWRRFRRDRPTIVHTHTAKAGAVGRVAAALAGVPVRVHTFHGHVLGGSYFSPGKTAVYRFMERVLARLTHRLIAVSDGVADELAGIQGIAPRERFVTVALGLDLGRFVALDRGAARERIRTELGIGADEPTIGIIGRIVPVKNHALLLRSLSHLENRDDPPRIIVVGGGEERFVADLRVLAERIGVGPRVHWLGWRNDVAELHAAVDVLAVPSHDEGTPVAIIEALATGTPVVARAVGGVPEMLRGNTTSRLVYSAGPGDFASALEDVLARSAVDAEEEARSRYEAQARYSTDRLARETMAVYREALRQVGLGPLGL